MLRFLLFVLLVGVWLEAVVPLASGMAGFVEEAAGLVTVLPDWTGTEGRVDVPFAGGSLVTERYQPVGGLLAADGHFTPVMVDGHIGAIAFAPYRWAAQIGGLGWARALSVAGGVAVFAGVLQLCRELGSPLAGWLAVLLMATSTHFLFMYQWVRPDERWTWSMPLFAVLALVRHAKTGHRRWLIVAGACAGLAVAAKTTAVLTLGGMCLAALVFRLTSHMKRLDYALLAGAAVPPMLPQVLWTLHGNHAAFDVRVTGLPDLRELLDPQRLAWFFWHFLDSFGGLGDYVHAATTGQPLHPGLVARISGLVILVAVIASFGLAIRRTTSRPQRAYGLALGATLVAYLTVYYRGMSLYNLLALWLPVAVALVLVQLWSAGKFVALRRGIMVSILVLLCGNGIAQTRILHRAVAHPQFDLMSRSVHEDLATALIQANILRPWTSTFNAVGELEVTTTGQVRPHHAFDLIRLAVRQTGETMFGYDLGWDRVLALARKTDSSGRSDFVLQPAACDFDVSPLKHREWLAGRFEQAVARNGGRISQLRQFRAEATGPVLLTWATVQWPIALAR